MTIQNLQIELLKLSNQERLRLLHWLVDTISSTSFAPVQELDQSDFIQAGDKSAANPLLKMAGRFSGGLGNTAEQVERILETEIKTTSGLSL
jgi:hypothetical protein